jgi:Tfp pilus assembly protein PilO
VTILARIFAEKRMLVIPLLIGVAVNALGYAMVVGPLGAQAAGAEQRASRAAADLANARAQAAAARQLVGSKARAAGDLATFYEEVLPKGQAAARQVTYLRLAELAEAANLQFERRTFTQEQERDSKLVRLDMTMSVTGSYRAVRRFIHDLETSPEFMVVSSVALVQGKETDAPLDFTLQVATYFKADDGR